MELERETLGGTREGTGETLGSNNVNKEGKERATKEAKQKPNVFQRVFESITKIIRELWLERNTDCHRPLKGYKTYSKDNRSNTNSH